MGEIAGRSQDILSSGLDLRRVYAGMDEYILTEMSEHGVLRDSS